MSSKKIKKLSINTLYYINNKLLFFLNIHFLLNNISFFLNILLLYFIYLNNYKKINS